MKGGAPCWDALYAVIAIDDAGIHAKGNQKHLCGAAPYELGFPPEEFCHRIRAAVRDRDLPLTAMGKERLIDYEDS